MCATFRLTQQQKKSLNDFFVLFPTNAKNPTIAQELATALAFVVAVG
jgi:hypothetical protein